MIKATYTKTVGIVCFSLALLSGGTVLTMAARAQPGPERPKEQKALPAKPEDVWCVALTADDRFAAAGAGWWEQPGDICIWDLPSRKLLKYFTEPRGVASVAFSPDGKVMASGSWSGGVRLRAWQTGEELDDLDIPGVARVAFSPDGKLLAAAAEAKIVRLWDAATRELIADLEGELFRFHCLAFTPDGKRLLAGGGDWKKGGICQVNVWDLASKKQVLKLLGHDIAVLAIAISPDGRTIATAGLDATIRLWEAESGKALKTLRGHVRSVDTLAFSPDSKTLVSAGNDVTIRFWDVEEGSEKRRFPPLHQEPGKDAPAWGFFTAIRSIRFTSDGAALLAGGGPKTVRLFDVAGAKETAVLWQSPSPLIPGAADAAQAELLKAQQLQLEQASSSTGPPRGKRWLVVLAIVAMLALIAGGLLVVRFRKSPRAPATARPARDNPASKEITFTCPGCAKMLKTSSAPAGKSIKCPHCGKVFQRRSARVL